MSEQHDMDFEAEVVRLGLPLSMKSGQACRMMNCGPTKLRELIAEGRIDGRKRDKDLVVQARNIRHTPPVNFFDGPMAPPQAPPPHR